ncbi:hypothetical protein H4R18_001356 [Coemansia javaensis]|uniref:Selenoprotein O n=1 Tax=Coemansia javaensis TaxID=2761396 RepID=A0A9W8HE11_9FUNG|nr:hypothetical protein H4R18_001356 [Coemansia javaensis]
MSDSAHTRLWLAAGEWAERPAWADTFTRELPGDRAVGEAPYAAAERLGAEPDEDGAVAVAVPAARLRAPRTVRGALWSWAVPERQPAPRLVAVSAGGARLVGLEPGAFWRDARAAAEAWSGGRRVGASHPWAHCYGGHQFGVWADQLGDGRAVSLGEAVGPGGARWEVQLKGAGPTPYSRFADGYAVRRSSIREFLAAEHLAALRVPSSRSLTLVFTGRTVRREADELGAVVARLAPSWVRFGSFELPAARRDLGLVRALADYVVRHHFADVIAAGPDRYAGLLRAVVRRTAAMVARWQAVGFCHGVMNTDNMSVLGLTIDYGPFAFLDAYDPGFICNHSDPGGRYAFGEQPRVALWNLLRLAGPLAALMDEGAGPPSAETVAAVQAILGEYGPAYRDEYAHVMRRKLGLFGAPRAGDVEAVVQPLLDLLAEARADYSHALRALCDAPHAVAAAAAGDGGAAAERLAERIAQRSLGLGCDPGPWQRRLAAYLLDVYGPRLREDAASGQPLSASAAAAVGERMRGENPRLVLRNWVAQDVIERAAAGDEAWVGKALEALTTHAFADQLPADLADAEKYAGPVPAWGEGLVCSCSS